ncbi:MULTISPECIES: hypothetical protein [unclassified Microcoleus]|nr:MULTISPECIES: hypothetical protein [unclassified Microcoleus]
MRQLRLFLLQTHNLKTDTPDRQWCVRIILSVVIYHLKTDAPYH